MPESAQPCLSVKGLTKAFNSTKQVLSGIDLEIEPASRVALLGSNGAGKSTFLKCLVGQVQPDSGKITLLGTEISSKPSKSVLRTVRRRTGFVFQQHCLVRQQTALSNVCHGLLSQAKGYRAWNQRIACRGARELAQDSLQAVGLSHLGHQLAQSLSGGQAQRVAIARALVGDPELLLADEPTASLDPSAGAAIMQLLSDLAKERQRTLLFTTHNLDHAFEFADRIVLFADGRMKLDLSTKDDSRSLVEAHFST